MNPIRNISRSEGVSMADEWFEFATLDHFWIVWRFNVIKQVLLKLPSRLGVKFLEIACGHGLFINQMSLELGQLVDGCDLNLNALNKVKDPCGEIYVYNIFEKSPEMLNKY